MKVRVALMVIGVLVVVVSGVVIYALFYLSHGHLTGPGLAPPSAEQITYTAADYAGLVTARALAVLLPVLGLGIIVARQSATRRPRGSSAFLVLAGLFVAGAGLIIIVWGNPTLYQAVLADGTFAHMFISLRASAGYHLFSAALLPLGLATAGFGLTDAVRLWRTSRPVLATQ